MTAYQQPASSTTAAIDLGAGWRQQPSERDRPDARSALRRVAAAVAVVLTLALGGAVPGRRLQELATVALDPQGDYQIIDDVLLVRGAGRLTGYGIGDGRRRWDIALPGTAGSGMMATGDVPGLMITEMQDLAAGSRTTYAVDIVAGAIRWQDDLPLAAVRDVAVGVSPHENRALTQVTVRDVRTGQVRWRLPKGLPAIDFAGLGDRQSPARLWALQPTGELVEHDLSDGRVLGRHRLELGGATPVDLSLSGDELILETVRGGTKVTTRYTTVNLSPISLTAPFVRRSDCGSHWCVTSQPADTQLPADPVEIVDKATGAVVLRLPADTFIGPTPYGLLIARPEPGVHGQQAVALVEPQTGRTLIDLTGWDLHRHYLGRGPILARGPVAGPVEVAWLRPGGLEVVQLPALSSRCDFAIRVVACPRPDARLTLWRLPG